MTGVQEPDEQSPAGPPSPPSWRPTIATIVVLVLIATLGLWWRSSRDDGGSDAGTGSTSRVVQQYPLPDRATPADFTARLLDDATFDSTTLRGTVAVYNVWGSWCGPCRTEAPDLAMVAKEYRTSTRFVGINVRDNAAAAIAFEREFEVPYPSIHPDDSASAILSFGGALAAAAVPSTVILDLEGKVAARVVGPVTASTLAGLIDDVLAETSP